MNAHLQDGLQAGQHELALLQGGRACQQRREHLLHLLIALLHICICRLLIGRNICGGGAASATAATLVQLGGVRQAVLPHSICAAMVCRLGTLLFRRPAAA